MEMRARYQSVFQYIIYTEYRFSALLHNFRGRSRRKWSFNQALGETHFCIEMKPNYMLIPFYLKNNLAKEQVKYKAMLSIYHLEQHPHIWAVQRTCPNSALPPIAAAVGNVAQKFSKHRPQGTSPCHFVLDSNTIVPLYQCY